MVADANTTKLLFPTPRGEVMTEQTDTTELGVCVHRMPPGTFSALEMSWKVYTDNVITALREAVPAFVWVYESMSCIHAAHYTHDVDANTCHVTEKAIHAVHDGLLALAQLQRLGKRTT